MAEDPKQPPGGPQPAAAPASPPPAPAPGGQAARQPGGAPPKDSGKKKPLWPWAVAGMVAVVFIGIVLWIIFAPHARQHTADAYVTAHFAVISPKVSGRVSAVPVTDNQPVKAGDLLLALDDGDYRAALQQAQANLASDAARVAEAQLQVRRQAPLIQQAEAQVRSAEAKLGLSRADSERYANLATTGSGTVQQHQQADTAVKQDNAALDQASAEARGQRRQLEALGAAVATAKARLEVDRAQVVQAELNLSYTRIVAPIDGVVDQRQVQVGNVLSAGAPVMTVVPLEGVYVLANYREPALRHMRPGQVAKIHLDAYAIDLEGRVDSLPPASGASYSPIPAANASGNFTRIVQRLPVKIVFLPNQRLTRLVRVGMSAATTVDTRLDDVVGAQRRTDRAVTGWR